MYYFFVCVIIDTFIMCMRLYCLGVICQSCNCCSMMFLHSRMRLFRVLSCCILFWWALYWWNCTAQCLGIRKPIWITTRQLHSTCFITPCRHLEAFYYVWRWCIYLYVLATKYDSSMRLYLEHKYTHILGKPGHTHF